MWVGMEVLIETLGPCEIPWLLHESSCLLVAGLEESPGEEGGCAQHRRDKPEHNRAQCPHSDVIGHKHEQQGPSPLDKSSFDSLQKAFGFGVEAPCAVQWKVADTRESRRGVAVMSGCNANQHRCCAHCNTRARALT